MDKVVHFELPFEDLARAKKFYSIFGWQLHEMPEMDYVSVITSPMDENRTPKQPGSINGGMMKRSKMVKAPVIAIHISSVDDYVKKVKANGGKIIMDKIEIPGVGYYAYVEDTEGNVIGLWETLKK